MHYYHAKDWINNIAVVPSRDSERSVCTRDAGQTRQRRSAGIRPHFAGRNFWNGHLKSLPGPKELGRTIPEHANEIKTLELKQPKSIGNEHYEKPEAKVLAKDYYTSGRSFSDDDLFNFANSLGDNKINHLMQPKHDLDVLVNPSGGVNNLVYNTLQSANGCFPDAGTFTAPVEINGQIITIQGTIQNDILKLGTMYKGLPKQLNTY